MTNIDLFFLTLYISGVTIVSYKYYALQKGWPIGTLFQSESGIMNVIGFLTIIGSVVGAFFFVKWYLVLAGIVVGWLISGFITFLFGKNTQFLSIFIFSISWLLLFAGY